jgi:hypothetical protein
MFIPDLFSSIFDALPEKILAHVVLGVKLFDTQFKRRLLKPLREFYFAHFHL